jgi:hypothetical protein
MLIATPDVFEPPSDSPPPLFHFLTMPAITPQPPVFLLSQDYRCRIAFDASLIHFALCRMLPCIAF